MLSELQPPDLFGEPATGAFGLRDLSPRKGVKEEAAKRTRGTERKLGRKG